MATAGAGSSDDRQSGIWSVLPSFDPAVDDIKEYVAKVKFIDGICPKKDRTMLAPRLAMLCKGTAWHQVRAVSANLLTDADNGVKHFLSALSSWEESAELKTFDLFEKAIYKTYQKADESTQSFVNRLNVAFHDVGLDTTLKTVRAFVLLKQSNLSMEDKKKVLTITSGVMDIEAVEQAMRSLSTNVLTGTTDKKKVYPTNYVNSDDEEQNNEETQYGQPSYLTQYEDEEVTQEYIENLAASGDGDALAVQGFERDLTDLFQEVPELHSALTAYQEARGRIAERRKSRGFWPVKGGKGRGAGWSSSGTYNYKGFKKGSSKGKEELLQRIARTHCKICGERGHWRAECPQKAKESANIATIHTAIDEDAGDQIIVEDLSEEEKQSDDQTVLKNHAGSSHERAFCHEAFVTDTCMKARKFEPIRNQFMLNRIKAFFAAKLQKPSMPARKSECSSKQAGHPKIVPSCISKTGTSGFESRGLAIIDTGASRSVIGDENLPKLLASLNADTRSMVREKSSRVGFRFGNNQIEHSYKQIQIPVNGKGQRIWLAVEVVPKATPFLLSIQVMKHLGAVINLKNQTCHFQTLHRSVPVIEGKTGLFLMRMQDLCTGTSHKAFVTSSPCESIEIPACSVNADQHADSRRSDANDSRHSGIGDEFTACTFDTAHESSRHPSVRSRSPSRTRTTDASVDGGSQQPEDEDRGDCTISSTWNDSQGPRKRNFVFPPGLSRTGGTGNMGARSSGDSNRNEDTTTKTSASCTRDTKDGDSGNPDLRQDHARSHWKPCILFESRSLRAHTSAGKPSIGKSNHSADHEDRKSKLRTSRTSTGSRLDTKCTAAMGKQESHLGKEASEQDLPGGLRDGSPVCAMVPEPNQFPRSADLRFCTILPDPSANGESNLRKPLMWEQFACEQYVSVSNNLEAKWIQSLKNQPSITSRCRQIDLLEVYAQPNSRLAEEVQKKGGKVMRFTRQHGDLSTYEGQVALIRMIAAYKPKHVWMAPECFPWCAWNRFNAGRSLANYQKIQQSRELSRVHMQLCAFVCKIQVDGGRHFTLENPGASDLWHQSEIKPVIDVTMRVSLDQCRFGLVHPEDQRPLKKYTRLQTTSRAIVNDLDGRRCQKDHEHCPIAGSCKVGRERMALSRYAAFYPRILARAAAQSILRERHESEFPIYPADELTEPVAKRARTREPKSEMEVKRPREESKHEPEEIADEYWDTVFEWCQNNLPKSGISEIPVESMIGQLICASTDIRCVKQIRAAKGLERYMIGNPENEVRHTFCQCRKTKKYFDLGEEQWVKQTLRNQKRHAIPSHIMICVFGTNSEYPPLSTETSSRSGQEPQPSREMKVQIAPKPESNQIRKEENEQKAPSVTVPAWRPQSVVQSGPKFLELDSEKQSQIRKIHNNLGHPTAERLSAHLKHAGARADIIEGAKDYACQSCSERTPPKLTTPGKLKEPREFNERVSMDGFEWKNKQGTKFYVLHFFDESTHFHLGKRAHRSAEGTEKCMFDTWLQWAGPPNELCFDEAGEFVSQKWKDIIQKEGINPITSAAPWQRGRIERHGGVIKEMLSRIENEHGIVTEKEFDHALYQCFQAKNSMMVSNGYSPEQALLGKSRKLPASICSDEETTAHSIDNNDDTRSESFMKNMQIRTAARKAFLESDNSSAIRRALLRQSRGQEHDWQLGELAMIWDKRKSPNMLEKGRWVGPCQIVMHEGRTIVWATHMNKLYRVARENLRPVSMREFQSRQNFVQICEKEKLEAMAKQLEQQLHERSGMFQFQDLTEGNTSPIPVENEQGEQPEEEPHRRDSNAGDSTNEPGAEEAETPPNNDAVDPSSINPPEESTESLTMPEGEGVSIIGSQPESIQDSNGVCYNALFVENENSECMAVEDDGTLWSKCLEENTAQSNFCMFEFTAPVQQVERFCQNPCLFAKQLTKSAKKTHTEVRYSQLTEEERKQFDEAKMKEMKCWLETDAVKPLLKSRIHPSKIMSSRWILTWKVDPTIPGGRKPKARIVVRGFEDPDLASVSTESPTLSRDGRMVILQTVSSMHWQLQSFDIKTAFLRGRSDHRQLAMEPVKELRELLHMKDNETCLLQGNAYGRVDAPIIFYKELRKKLEEVGFEAHPLDSCMFLLRNPTNPKILEGILGTHVDDGIGGGTSLFEQALKKIQEKLPFGQREYGKFRFTGLDIEQYLDSSIRINQADYISKIEPIDVSKVRRKEEEANVDENELQQLRGLCGSLQYAAVHSRPDLAAKVAFLQKRISQARVRDLLEGNRVLREAKEYSETSVFVKPIPIKELTFASFGDASFASEQQLRAQQGVFIVACTDQLRQNQTSEISPIAWNSKQIGRVVRSTLSAEAYAMSSSLDKLTWIRCMWGIVQDPDFQWQKPEKALQSLPKALLVTDCKSLYDLMTKLAVPNCQEWRTTIEVMMLREQSGEHSICRWISTAIMLADALTKPMDASFLRQVLWVSRFRIFDEEKALKENPNKRFSTRWLAADGSCEKENTMNVKPAIVRASKQPVEPSHEQP